LIKGNTLMKTMDAMDRPGVAEISAGTLGRTLAAGAAGLVVWELFARLIAPIWLGGPLDPTRLIEAALGVSGMAAQGLHLLTGLVFFPIVYVFMVRPLEDRLLPAMRWIVSGLGYGVALWVFAMYGMASLLGGMSPFPGFEPIAWLSLVGHIGLAMGIAATTAMLEGGSH